MSGQQLADIQVGSVEGICLPQAVVAHGIFGQIPGGEGADKDLIEILHQTAVIRIRVGQQEGLGGGVEIRDQRAQDGKRLLTVPGIAAVDAEDLSAAADDGRVTAAGGLDQ